MMKCAMKFLTSISTLAIVAASAAPAWAQASDDLVKAAKQEGQLSVIALPHDWCGYGGMIDGFKAKYGLKMNELNPDAGSGDEVEAIRANKGNKGPQAPDVIDVGLSFGPTAKSEGLLMPYKVSTWATIPADQKDADGAWYGDYYGVLTFEVNKDIVKTSPADWPDLLGGDYANTVALAGDPRTSNQAILAVYAAGLSKADGDAAKAAQAGLDFFAAMNKKGNLVPTIGKVASLAQGATPIVVGGITMLSRTATRSRAIRTSTWWCRRPASWRASTSRPSAPSRLTPTPPSCGWTTFTRTRVRSTSSRVTATRSASPRWSRTARCRPTS